MTDATLLLRQIHPNFIHNGIPTHIAFRPFPRDEGLLSVYDGDLITPEKAFTYHTSERQLKSSGVLGVTVSECASLALPAASSPEEFPEHAHVNFRAHAKKEIDAKSKSLLALAIDRDWLHRPDA